MPNIKSPKKPVKKQQPKPNKLVKLPAPANKSTHDYYCCCAEKTKQGIPKGTKITQLTQHCKNNAKEVTKAKQQAREREKKKILASWKQIGLSLSKIITSA